MPKYKSLTPQLLLEVYHRKGSWRWSLSVKRNGETIAAATEGYVRRDQCYKNLSLALGLDLLAPQVREKYFAYDLQSKVGSRVWVYP